MKSRSKLLPLVSVCIPTFNRKEYLRDCIQSALLQRYDHLEIIVSDNGSTDGTSEMLAETENIIVLKHDVNIGMVNNWNSVVSMARGQFIVLLSDDDLLMPEFVSTMVSHLKNKTVEFAYSRVIIIDEQGRIIGQSPNAPSIESSSAFVENTMSQRRVPYGSALIFRRSSAVAVGLFCDIGNQTDVAFRIALAELQTGTNVYCHQVPLAYYRIHPTSLTDDPSRRIEGRMNFQSWVIQRYGPQSRFGRQALLDLFQLRARGLTLTPAASGAITNLGSGWFGFRVRRWVELIPGRKWIFAAFPLLALEHLRRFVNNRVFHDRLRS